MRLSNKSLFQVLKLYDIDVVEFNGSMTEKAKALSLANFKSEEPGTARVMLLSNVGTTGLNLDFANVLIIIVRNFILTFNLKLNSRCQDALWSVMEDLQLQGRLKRYPQNKQCEIYRLIGARTADEVINKLSTGKGVIHELFTGAPLAFREQPRSSAYALADFASIHREDAPQRGVPQRRR